MPSNFKTKTLTLLLLAAACVFAAYFAYRQYQHLSGSRALLNQAEAEKTKLEDAQKQINKFLEEYASLTGEQTQANAALPVGGANAATVLAQVDKLAQLSGLTLGSLSIRDKNVEVKIAENGVDFQDIEMEVSGSYPAFSNFLLLVEANLRLIDVQNISARAEEENLIKYKLVMRTYYQK